MFFNFFIPRFKSKEKETILNLFRDPSSTAEGLNQ